MSQLLTLKEDIKVETHYKPELEYYNCKKSTTGLAKGIYNHLFMYLLDNRKQFCDAESKPLVIEQIKMYLGSKRVDNPTRTPKRKIE